MTLNRHLFMSSHCLVIRAYSRLSIVMGKPVCESTTFVYLQLIHYRNDFQGLTVADPPKCRIIELCMTIVNGWEIFTAFKYSTYTFLINLMVTYHQKGFLTSLLTAPLHLSIKIENYGCQVVS